MSETLGTKKADIKFDNSILLVDDEQSILDVMKTIISKFVANVYTTTDPKAAIEIAKEKKVDVAVLDIKMPQMDGLILLREIKTNSPTTTCIMSSGMTDKDNIQTALRFGAYDVLEKPINQVMLKLCIIRAIEKTFSETITREVMSFMFDAKLLDKANYETMSIGEKQTKFKDAFTLVKQKFNI